MPVLLVHGNPETSAIWVDLLAALTKRGVRDCETVSPPGFGVGVPDGWDATQLSYRDWLIERVESYGEPVHLVGHDWGSPHVMGATEARSDLIASWAVDCGGLFHPDYQWHDMAQAWQTPEIGEAVVEAMVEGSLVDRIAGYVDLGIPETVAAELADATDATMGRCILALYRSAAQPAMSQLGQRLAETALPPGLVIVATEDGYAGSPEQAEATAQRFGASTVTLQGAGHWWMFDHADTVADRLVALWDRSD
ncbi:MAG: alpha/beta hydrolase [Acidobacteria bacterium]|nr:alpha/beta hydrolase [Acidobacteriota bacterium]